MKLTIFGTGYVGLVTGVCFAEKGHQVTCVDIDEAKITQLRQGVPTIYEPGLAELLKQNIAEKHISFTTDAKAAVQNAEVIFIAVGTPQADDGQAFMDYFFTAAKTIATHCHNGLVVVDKSTVPVGTARKVEDIFAAQHKTVHIISNPETLREGSAIHDFMSPDRIIIGARSEEGFAVMRKLYSPFLIREDSPGRIIEMTPESAELVKYATNTMLAQRISFVNYLSQMCNVLGADIREVRRGIGSDHRIGNHFLYAGPGFGGSCFPKDVSALVYQSKQAGITPILPQAILDVNESQKAFVEKLVLQALGNKKTVGIWGLTFKAKTDDIRGSSSIYLAESLLKAHKTVLVHDPIGVHHFMKVVPGCTAMEKDDILTKCDVLVIMTEWDDYRTLTDEQLHSLQGKAIIDARNILARDVEIEKIRKHNIKYAGIGIQI